MYAECLVDVFYNTASQIPEVAPQYMKLSAVELEQQGMASPSQQDLRFFNLVQPWDTGVDQEPEVPYHLAGLAGICQRDNVFYKQL